MKYDGIIVLGAGIIDAKLTEEGLKRLNLGISLFKEGVADRLFLTGGRTFWDDEVSERAEADLMREHALEEGIPENKIFIEEESADTVGNAIYVKKQVLKMSTEKPLTDFIVVTSNYHVKRSKYIFEQVFGTGFNFRWESVEITKTPERLAREDAVEGILREWFQKVPLGDHELVEERIKELHPGYSKNPKYSREDIKAEIARRLKGL